MVYANKGYVQGILARDPFKVAEGVVLLTLRVRDDRINPTTRRREFYYPTFVVFGRESDRALKNLVKGQEVAIEYKIETRRKVIDGQRRYFEDKVATRIAYGRRPETAQQNEPNRPVVITQVSDTADNDLPIEDN